MGLRTSSAGELLTVGGRVVRVVNSQSKVNSSCSNCIFNSDKMKAKPAPMPKDWAEKMKAKFGKDGGARLTLPAQCPYLDCCTAANRPDHRSVYYYALTEREIEYAKKKRGRKPSKTTKKSTTKSTKK